MAISILAQAVVDKNSGGDTSYLHSGFAVPGGTTRLLVQVEYRGFSSGAAPALSSVTHNGAPLSFLAGSATTGGFDDITTWWGHLRDPDIGTFDIDTLFPTDVRGIKLWMLAISGEKASGIILGNSAFQRKAGAVTDTIGLGITPAASGDSLLLSSLAIAKNTTLTTWTGTSWTAVATDAYTGGGNLTSTSRYQLNALGGAALTVSAKFGATSTDIGGSLIEILAEPVGTDVSDTFGVTMAVTGSVAGGSSASLADASFRRRAKWTETFAFQPDLAGVDRRLIAAGPSSAPNLVVDQIASGSMYRWLYRLTDGTVTVDSAPGSQSVAAQHIALVHGGTDGPALYLNGTLSAGAVTGGELTGLTDIGAGGETIGSHATGTAYTGLIGRYLLHEDALSAEQVRLLALSQTDPDAIWGSGVEDDAEVANQSPVVLPMVVEPDGRPQITVRPTIIDPNGTGAVLSSVTLPTHGSVVIADKDLVITLEPGWVGRDSFTVTASDGSKTSTAKITINQTRPALLVQGDSITLTESSSTTFNPLANDIGAGTLRTISASNGAHGATVVLADGRISFTAGAVSGDTADSFSYTVSDDWGSASATVAVTIRESGTSFVSASNDSVETTVGAAIPIPVLANDTASSDNLPLVVQPGSITTPAPSGTAALQPDGQILYTPASGFTGDVSFNYTAKPASKPLPTSTATVSVRVVSAPTARPKYPFGFTSWTAAPASRIRPVGFGVTGAPGPAGGYTSLANAYAAAAAGGGDFIVLADSTYAENFDFNRDFPATNPVVITSRNIANGRSPMANFTGQPTVTGNGHWFYELRWTSLSPVGTNVASAYRPTISANNITITRCWFNTPNGPDIQGTNDRTGINIGWNRFVTVADRIGAFILCRVNNTPGSATPKLRNSAIYNNYFNKTGASTNGNDAYNVYFVAEHKLNGVSGVLPNVYIEYNYIAGSNQMTIYLKRHPTRLNFNHVTSGGQFGIRHGPVRYAENSSYNSLVDAATQMWGNRIVGPNMTFNGAGIDARGNYVKSPRGMLLFSGNKNAGGGVSGNYQAASDALLVGNNVDRSGGLAPINVGYHDKADDLLSDEDGGQIRNVRIFGQLGDMIKTTGSSAEGNIIFDAAQCLADTVTITLGNGGFTVPATITLNPDTDVGFQVANQNLST